MGRSSGRYGMEEKVKSSDAAGMSLVGGHRAMGAVQTGGEWEAGEWILLERWDAVLPASC